MIVKRNSKVNKVYPKQKRQPSGSEEEQKLYHTVRWRKVRKQLLMNEPLCRLCKAKGIVKVATIADHIEPQRLTDKDFYDTSNHQPLCVKCHAKKSKQEAKLYK